MSIQEKEGEKPLPPARVSLLWAQYNKLPEAFKKDFYTVSLKIFNKHSKSQLKDMENS